MPFLRRALDVCERTLGREHPYTRGSRNNLANLLQAQGRLDEAAALFRRAFEGYERTLGPEHTETRDARSGLPTVPQAQEERRLAESPAPDTLSAQSGLPTVPQAQETRSTGPERRLCCGCFRASSQAAEGAVHTEEPWSAPSTFSVTDSQSDRPAVKQVQRV